mmetsp:Transcript_25861/g.35580  ORF Transcript_25861/g.35580 Transcript_25861/m.35580 type:complete len:406 (-) Transcript_25861:92-1309(-)
MQRRLRRGVVLLELHVSHGAAAGRQTPVQLQPVNVVDMHPTGAVTHSQELPVPTEHHLSHGPCERLLSGGKCGEHMQQTNTHSSRGLLHAEQSQTLRTGTKRREERLIEAESHGVAELVLEGPATELSHHIGQGNLLGIGIRASRQAPHARARCARYRKHARRYRCERHTVHMSLALKLHVDRQLQRLAGSVLRAHSPQLQRVSLLQHQQRVVLTVLHQSVGGQQGDPAGAHLREVPGGVGAQLGVHSAGQQRGVPHGQRVYVVCVSAVGICMYPLVGPHPFHATHLAVQARREYSLAIAACRECEHVTQVLLEGAHQHAQLHVPELQLPATVSAGQQRLVGEQQQRPHLRGKGRHLWLGLLLIAAASFVAAGRGRRQDVSRHAEHAVACGPVEAADDSIAASHE